MVYQSQFGDLLMQYSHKLLSLFAQFIQYILLLKDLRFGFTASFSLPQKQRGNIFLLDYILHVLVSHPDTNSRKHPKIPVGELARCLVRRCLVSVHEALNLSNVEFLIFLYYVSGQVQRLDPLNTVLHIVRQRFNEVGLRFQRQILTRVAT
jgi:hypothetical protein